MKNRRLIFVVAACLAVIQNNAIASLMEANLFSQDDALLTRDTDSGLDWLDLTETSNKSINEVLGGYGGFIGQGFRYATISEVSTLYTNAGIGINTQAPGSWPGANNLISLMGLTSLAGEFRWSEGFAGLNEPSQDMAYQPGVWRRETFTQGAGGIIPGGTVSYDYSGDGVGSYLVRATVIPIPSALWLFGTGLLGLVGVVRKKAT